jgi:3'-phosphoadenosine 5'-phosphosulfate sulfotransferase (PAPS reductase)/FAD synthetase
MLTNEAEILELAARGALFAVNDSGGKDSQAMRLLVQKLVPASQIVLIHAVLEEVDWEGTVEHIQGNAQELPLLLAYPAKTFFQMVDHRGKFPDPSRRQCTSDLKRGPIEREIRRYLAKNPQFGGLVVNCMGMRAQESASRSKLQTLKRNDRNSVAGREWFDWLPIHELNADQVFATIADAGQKPHWAYEAGMTRLSCCFCIMASKGDLTTAAKLKPALYARYCQKERDLGFTLSPSRKTLPEITGIAA